MLDTIPVELNGTPFQKTVWQALRRIPGGTTISYAELAKRIGEPSAVRAVGTANGANPGGRHRPLPPRHRLERQAHRLRRRARP